MSREYSRGLRVAAELQRILNDLLQLEVKDPRLKGVRVSEVQLSGDLGVARVFYSTLDPDADVAPVEASLRKAAAFLRGRLGREIRLRRIPELRFLQDESAREGLRMTKLIGDAAASPDENGRADD